MADPKDDSDATPGRAEASLWERSAGAEHEEAIRHALEMREWLLFASRFLLGDVSAPYFGATRARTALEIERIFAAYRKAAEPRAGLARMLFLEGLDEARRLEGERSKSERVAVVIERVATVFADQARDLSDEAIEEAIAAWEGLLFPEPRGAKRSVHWQKIADVMNRAWRGWLDEIKGEPLRIAWLAHKRSTAPKRTRGRANRRSGAR